MYQHRCTSNRLRAPSGSSGRISDRNDWLTKNCPLFRRSGIDYRLYLIFRGVVLLSPQCTVHEQSGILSLSPYVLRSVGFKVQGHAWITCRHQEKQNIMEDKKTFKGDTKRGRLAKGEEEMYSLSTTLRVWRRRQMLGVYCASQLGS